jgi:hypothetical protein
MSGLKKVSSIPNCLIKEGSINMLLLMNERRQGKEKKWKRKEKKRKEKDRDRDRDIKCTNHSCFVTAANPVNKKMLIFLFASTS